MPTDNRGDVGHFMPGSEVVLQLGPVCIETAARQAWRRIVEKLTAGKDMTSMRQASLLREFIEATDFARMRSEHQELAGGLRCQVRLHWAPDGGVRWELFHLRGENGPQ